MIEAIDENDFAIMMVLEHIVAVGKPVGDCSIVLLTDGTRVKIKESYDSFVSRLKAMRV